MTKEGAKPLKIQTCLFFHLGRNCKRRIRSVHTKSEIDNYKTKKRSHTMKSSCQTAITNLQIYLEKWSDPASSHKELLAIHDAVYDKNWEMKFNGKRYNYKHSLQHTLARDQVLGIYSNFEAEILDNITFHYTFDVHQKGMPPKSCKMHQMATVNPNNRKIISTKIMTGQLTNEISQFNKKYIETVEMNIVACKTSSASTRSQNTNHKYVRNVPSAAVALPAGSMNKNYNRRSKNSIHLVASRILKRSSTMSTRISTILSRNK